MASSQATRLGYATSLYTLVSGIDRGLTSKREVNFLRPLSVCVRTTEGRRLPKTSTAVGTVWHHEVLHRRLEAYERHLDAEQHQVGKENTQKIESKHINLRTRIKRLVRRTICFSKMERMHDLVIGLFINRYEFGRAI